MISEKISAPGRGSLLAPVYYEGPATPDVDNEVYLHERLYTYEASDGLVAGWVMNVMFTIDRAAHQVWPYFKNFNLWQPHHQYSGVIGDLEGKTYTLRMSADAPEPSHKREVIRVIPEHVIVTSSLLPEDGSVWPGLPGRGGRKGGFSVFQLNGHAGRTVVTVFMEHGAYTRERKPPDVDAVLAPWREKDMAPEWQRKWREDFIPTLKKVVYGAAPK